jgi:hypothetical protein
MAEAKTDTGEPVSRDRANKPLPYDPVVEALRVLARHGRQLREAEECAAAQAAVSEASDELATDIHHTPD